MVIQQNDQSLGHPKLELFVRDWCPYCQRVLRFVRENGIELTVYDCDEDPKADARLRMVGGKSQVPCLFIDGKPMYESADIIAYLRQ